MPIWNPSNTGSQNPGEQAQLVKPKRAFRPRMLRDWELAAVENITDLEDLADSIADIEDDRKGVPVLLRQYLRWAAPSSGST